MSESCPISNYEQVIARYISTVRMNKYIPHEPTAKQALFLMHDHIPEILFGGAAGPGKTDGLLMAALQYVDVPGYAALLLRRTYSDLALPGAIMDRSHEWLEGKGVHWSDEKKTWTFPSGATLTFGYLEGPRDKYRYQSSEFQFCGFDELSQFKKDQYLYLHSRLRRLIDCDIPIRMRAASNPGDIGHDWVKERFINPKTREKDCVFIPAFLIDNPHLDRESYIKSLEKLDPVTREQLLNGNWDIRSEGNLFKHEWFKDRIIPSGPGQYPALCRFWDKAATEGKGDWTAGVLIGLKEGQYYVLDVRRTQSSPLGVESLIKQTAQSDFIKYGPGVKIRIEQEPGSSGVNDIDHYARQVLTGFNFAGIKSTGSKISRAGIASSAAENRNLWIIQDRWTDDYLTELCLFPQIGVHDDQVDATSGAVIVLSQGMLNTMFPPGIVDQNSRPSPPPYDYTVEYHGVIGASQNRNASVAFGIGHLHAGRVIIDLLTYFNPANGALDWSQIAPAIKMQCRQYRVEDLLHDGYEREAMMLHFNNFLLNELPFTTQHRLQVYTTLENRMYQGQIEYPRNDRLISELKSLQAKAPDGQFSVGPDALANLAHHMFTGYINTREGIDDDRNRNWPEDDPWGTPNISIMGGELHT